MVSILHILFKIQSYCYFKLFKILKLKVKVLIYKYPSKYSTKEMHILNKRLRSICDSYWNSKACITQESMPRLSPEKLLTRLEII